MGRGAAPPLSRATGRAFVARHACSAAEPAADALPVRAGGSGGRSGGAGGWAECRVTRRVPGQWKKWRGPVGDMGTPGGRGGAESGRAASGEEGVDTGG